MVALTSIAYSAFVFLSPSKTRLQVSYGLVAATLASGTYLVLSTHSPMLQACMMGLIYTGGVLAALVSARHKLTSAEAPEKKNK
jgi:hypothetical protein